MNKLAILMLCGMLSACGASVHTDSTESNSTATADTSSVPTPNMPNTNLQPQQLVYVKITCERLVIEHPFSVQNGDVQYSADNMKIQDVTVWGSEVVTNPNDCMSQTLLNYNGTDNN